MADSDYTTGLVSVGSGAGGIGRVLSLAQEALDALTLGYSALRDRLGPARGTVEDAEAVVA